ncbi:response regulator transcription factor [Plantactinospora soyae]|uniref:DNA-binding NarL/FixJ family response regulator n=1 Tax=Plantactinospora soyae TaxID=1544732 RepID=A0A927MAE3_9ACTN|nr:response regulator transcription factor [Plantactinospora soyae]MBE1489551.1 DNA-binding NarL/FixJ family response regulator [Plantactinospora soyae]
MGDLAETTRVVLVDDDALVRMGLRAMLDGVQGIRVVAEASDGADVPAVVDAHHPQVVLMDLRMKKVDGITATQRLHDRGNGPAVIVLTTFDEHELVVKALRAGAVGFLLKHAPPEDIVRAIRAARQGNSLLSPEIARRLITMVADGTGHDTDRLAARERLRSLSAREVQVATAVGDGKSNAEIAAALSLTVPTVKGYISTILGKTACNNRVQLALIVQAAATR